MICRSCRLGIHQICDNVDKESYSHCDCQHRVKEKFDGKDQEVQVQTEIELDS
jgi:hypothetical protein